MGTGCVFPEVKRLVIVLLDYFRTVLMSGTTFSHLQSNLIIICMNILHVCMHVGMYVCMSVSVHVCMYVCMYVRTYVCIMYVCVCMYANVCV